MSITDSYVMEPPHCQQEAGGRRREKGNSQRLPQSSGSFQDTVELDPVEGKVLAS